MSHDFGHLPSDTKTDIRSFYGTATANGNNWQTWTKPRGCSMIQLVALGGGGGGGNSVAGAASTAAGGGGGGSGAQAIVTFPAFHLPDVLYLSVGQGGAATVSGVNTYVSIAPSNTTDNLLVLAFGGTTGGTASGATAGAAGAGGTAPGISNMPLAGRGNFFLVAGQSGVIGGTTVAGANVTYSQSGQMVMGGAGGGGLPAANTAGSAGGGITAVGVLNGQSGGAGGTTAPTAGLNGQSGGRPMGKLLWFTGGTGGGSSGLTVTPTGSNGGNGGNGGFGCGGGGGGGAFTGSTAGVGGSGGSGLVVIIAW